jgi:hypothetical protein
VVVVVGPSVVVVDEGVPDVVDVDEGGAVVVVVVVDGRVAVVDAPEVEDVDERRDDAPSAAATVVLVDPSASSPASDESSDSPADDPIGPVLARITGWGGAT